MPAGPSAQEAGTADASGMRPLHASPRRVATGFETKAATAKAMVRRAITEKIPLAG
jgi:hypothetical protein